MSKSLETIDKLKEMFPLFTGYRVDSNGYIIINMGTHSMYVHEDLPEYTLKNLADEHKRLSIKKEWEEKFPHLYFYVGRGRDRPSDVWVKKNGRDADGIPYSFFKHEAGYPPKDKETVLRELAVWEKKAEQASQKDWFLCFICGEPKHRSEYGYYHFTANYCKSCLETHPEIAKNAYNENYE